MTASQRSTRRSFDQTHLFFVWGFLFCFFFFCFLLLFFSSIMSICLSILSLENEYCCSVKKALGSEDDRLAAVNVCLCEKGQRDIRLISFHFPCISRGQKLVIQKVLITVGRTFGWVYLRTYSPQWFQIV